MGYVPSKVWGEYHRVQPAEDAARLQVQLRELAGEPSLVYEPHARPIYARNGEPYAITVSNYGGAGQRCPVCGQPWAGPDWPIRGCYPQWSDALPRQRVFLTPGKSGRADWCLVRFASVQVRTIRFAWERDRPREIDPAVVKEFLSSSAAGEETDVRYCTKMRTPFIEALYRVPQAKELHTLLSLLRLQADEQVDSLVRAWIKVRRKHEDGLAPATLGAFAKELSALGL